MTPEEQLRHRVGSHLGLWRESWEAFLLHDQAGEFEAAEKDLAALVAYTQTVGAALEGIAAAYPKNAEAVPAPDPLAMLLEESLQRIGEPNGVWARRVLELRPRIRHALAGVRP